MGALREPPPRFRVLSHRPTGDDGSLDRRYEALTSRRSPSALVCGDATQILAAFPEDSVQTVVTSPPYWSLRNYGIEGQIGLEDSVEGFIKALTRTFDEVRRVLRKDGTLWLNIGDSYTSGGRTWRAPDKKNRARAMDIRPPTPDGLKPKDLIGVPWRLAFGLQAAGWYLRADMIWNKPNAQPESVGDRPTRSHEYVFLLSKSERYFYDVAAVRGPNGRRLRTVWDVKTQAMPEAKGHFATFPPGLIEPCILSASRPGDLILDPFAGSGTTVLVAGRHGRRFVGVELHPEYMSMAQHRLQRAGFMALDESDHTLAPAPVDPNPVPSTRRMMADYKPPYPSKQNAFHQLLVAACATILHSGGCPSKRCAGDRRAPTGLRCRHPKRGRPSRRRFRTVATGRPGAPPRHPDRCPTGSADRQPGRRSPKWAASPKGWTTPSRPRIQ
ncbi:MAG TPA: site-specific DNA-methyltransferase [Acidimicrobiales bacterium]|nr:site-specific DNA-methyltransferase [Acidimicrobiales bacterium]